MKMEKIAILISSRSWFKPYAKKFVAKLNGKGYRAKLFFDHESVGTEYGIVFMLSYFRAVEKKYLELHKHNLVVHESDLPKGRGWAPLIWQVLKGRNRIPVVLFSVNEGIDEGDIYIKDHITFRGHELHDEIREKQAKKTMELCMKFIGKDIKPRKQAGRPSFYRRRRPADSELDINKTIRRNFDLLRIVDNDKFPAFFRYKGNKYILRIYKSKDRLHI